MFLVLSYHAANSLEKQLCQPTDALNGVQGVKNFKSILVRRVIAGPCFRDPLAPEELTMKHVRAVPSVLVPQFLDEALQTHLISRSSLANPPLRKQRNKKL